MYCLVFRTFIVWFIYLGYSERSNTSGKLSINEVNYVNTIDRKNNVLSVPPSTFDEELMQEGSIKRRSSEGILFLCDSIKGLSIHT